MMRNLFRKLWRYFWPAKLPEVGGFLDERGVFRYRRTPTAIWTYLDVFEVDRLMRKHGSGDQWADAVTALREAEEADRMPGLADELRQAASLRRRQAFADLTDLSRKVFGLKPVSGVDGGGWSDSEAFYLLTDYLIAIGQLGSEFLPLPKQLARPAASPSAQGGN